METSFSEPLETKHPKKARFVSFSESTSLFYLYKGPSSVWPWHQDFFSALANANRSRRFRVHTMKGRPIGLYKSLKPLFVSQNVTGDDIFHRLESTLSSVLRPHLLPRPPSPRACNRQ
jgi:hypothetical protein